MCQTTETETQERTQGAGRPAPPGGSEPNTPVIALIGFLFAIVLFVVIVLLQAFFNHEELIQTSEKLVSEQPQELSDLLARQEEVLHAYRWVDEKKGVVAIPIERAMQLVVSELNAPAGPQATVGRRGAATRAHPARHARR